MKSHLRLRSACALLLGALAAGAGRLVADELRNHFDSDSLMRAPGFFDFVVVGQGQGKWLILDDPNPPSAPYRVAQVSTRLPEGAIATALRRNVELQDGDVSVFVKTGTGRGGVIVRMVDANNFLVLFADTATGELVLTSYRDGKPAELARGTAPFDRHWMKIGTKLAGPSVTVSVNDR